MSIADRVISSPLCPLCLRGESLGLIATQLLDRAETAFKGQRFVAESLNAVLDSLGYRLRGLAAVAPVCEELEQVEDADLPVAVQVGRAAIG